MTSKFHAVLFKEGPAWVAQCVEIELASDGETEEQAKANLIEALELYLEEPRATAVEPPPIAHLVEIEVVHA